MFAFLVRVFNNLFRHSQPVGIQHLPKKGQAVFISAEDRYELTQQMAGVMEPAWSRATAESFVEDVRASQIERGAAFCSQAADLDDYIAFDGLERRGDDHQTFGADAYTYGVVGRALKRLPQMRLEKIQDDGGRTLYFLRDTETGEQYLTYHRVTEYGQADDAGEFRAEDRWFVYKLIDGKFKAHYSMKSAVNHALKTYPHHKYGVRCAYRQAVQMGVITLFLTGQKVHIKFGNEDKARQVISAWASGRRVWEQVA